MNCTALIEHNLLLSNEEPQPYISHSIIHYKKESEKCLFTENESDAKSFINTYEYIHKNLPKLNISTSKLNAHSQLFYEFMEITNTFDLFSQYSDKSIYTFQVGDNSKSIIDFLKFYRADKKDEHFFQKESDTMTGFTNSIDFIYYEMDEKMCKNQNDYSISMIKMLTKLLYLQKNKGTCVLKISEIYCKPIVQILYLICIFYEKVYIIKPNISNIFTEEKYLVCKNFVGDLGKIIDCYQKLNNILESYETSKKEYSKICSVVQNEIPYNFICKIEEINIIMGQHKLEVYNQLINIMKNKNKQDKLEVILKNNIKKCSSWCEKFKIPCNKINDKMISSIFEKENDTIIADVINDIIEKVVLDECYSSMSLFL